MNRHEEIFLILKRIPEQVDYINKLLERDWIIGPIPNFGIDSIYYQMQRVKKDRLWNDNNGVIPSALGVLDNLIERLNELVYVDGSGDTARD